LDLALLGDPEDLEGLDLLRGLEDLVLQDLLGDPEDLEGLDLLEDLDFPGDPEDL